MKKSEGHQFTGSSLVATGLLVVAVAGCSGTPSPSQQSSASTQTTSSSPSGSPSTTSSPTPSGKNVAPVPVEHNPPGDIPDNLAFVMYTNKAGGYSFTHPEGWAETGSGVRVRFTDKLNGVAADVVAASHAPTVDSARTADVPRLKSSVPAFELRAITTVTVPGGKAVRIIFRRNSDPDPVTGKVYRDEVQEYLVYSSGHLVRMDLFGPVGADNVDAYRTMSQSLRIR
ncbi:PsbP-related protein [Pedococcus bigeumensis]|uniref:Lipoprotein n=1 Tax=Pedococcus bigeumensis TaxID=433644 RepID=A0A502CZT6_9MICO|nr:PsbP-related protein [Pedococcus bigeumensis]TPG17346.1 hypothetical protein EAH86_11465 [Pedococcus bigeumensis]